MIKEYLEEEWKPLQVEDCEYRYDISNYGRVKDKINGVMVSQVLTGKPQYYYVNLQPIYGDGSKGKRLLRRVHNLMGQVFIPKPDESLKVVDHIDRNKYNNSLDNLRWVCKGKNSRNMDNNVKMEDGRLVKDVCLEEGLPLHVFNNLYYGVLKEESPDSVYTEAYSKYFITFRGKREVRSEIESLIGIGSRELKHFLDKGLTYEEILDNRYKFALEEKEYCHSVECFGKWFTTKKAACDYYGVGLGTVNVRENQGESFEQALSPRERKDTRRKLIYKGEEHTFESLSELSGIAPELINDRINTKGWSIEKAVETPLQKIKFYYLNGVRMSKKSMLEKLGITNTKSFNSVHRKSNLSIQELLEQKYGIDLTDFKISLTP